MHWKPNGTVEETADPYPEPKHISRDAHNRQKLAIHSLLRQSDFVDDSREAALESSNETVPAAALPMNPEVATAPDISQGRVDWNIQDTAYQPWNFMPNDPNALYGIPFGVGMLNFGGGLAQGVDEMGNVMSGLDEQCMY